LKTTSAIESDLISTASLFTDALDTLNYSGEDVSLPITAVTHPSVSTSLHYGYEKTDTTVETSMDTCMHGDAYEVQKNLNTQDCENVDFSTNVPSITNPPFTHRRRFYYDQNLAENVADRDKSQEKRSMIGAGYP
jgi:hypothetical protein